MEYKGFWFLPDKKNKKVAGVLTVNPFKNNKLELIGGFENDLKSILNSQKKEVIFGEVYNDKNHLRLVTLFDCLYSFSNNFSAKHPIVRYNCSVFIDGMHILSLDSNSCNKLSVDLTSLYYWKNAGVIRSTLHFPKGSEILNQPDKICIELDKKDIWEIPVKLSNTITLSLYADGTYSTTSDQVETNIKQFTRVKIESKDKVSIKTLLKKIDLFKQFLSFATLAPIYFNEVWLYSPEYYRKLSNDGKKELPANTYFKHLRNGETKTKSIARNHLFNYLDIESTFPEILKKWYEVSSEIAPIRNHLIESIKPLKVFSSINFLIVIQAIEGYHRKFRIPEWKKLRIRLKNLVDEFNDIDRINNITDDDIKMTVASRDYYSHFLIDKEGVLEGIELLELTKKMKVLLICCVLNLVGFQNEKINDLLRKNTNVI